MVVVPGHTRLGPVQVQRADGRAALLLAYAAEMSWRDGRPVAMADVEARVPGWPGLFEPPATS